MGAIEGANIAWNHEASKKALRFEDAGSLPDSLSPLDTSTFNKSVGQDECTFGECDNRSRFHNGGRKSKAYKHETVFLQNQRNRH